jgi:HSP20 family protein
MLTRWNNLAFPTLDRNMSMFDELRREMDRVFAGFERDVTPDLSRADSWPRVSLYDTGAALVVRAEMPGYTEKDISISLEQSSLTLSGERKLSVPKGYSVHRQERGDASSFSRMFTLPCRVDADKSEAKLTHGMLELTLPKVPEERPRQITIQA